MKRQGWSLSEKSACRSRKPAPGMCPDSYSRRPDSTRRPPPSRGCRKTVVSKRGRRRPPAVRPANRSKRGTPDARMPWSTPAGPACLEDVGLRHSIPGLRTVRNRFPLLTPSHFRSNCHCERSVAISMRLNTRRLTALATTTKLPRCARNDIGGQWKGAGLVGPQFAFPLLGDAEPGVWHGPLVLGVSPSPQPSPIEGEGWGDW